MKQAAGGGKQTTEEVETSRTFTGHHGTRLKAIVTCALEAPKDVGARAVTTGVANAALIGVCWNTNTVHFRSSARRLN